MCNSLTPMCSNIVGHFHFFRAEKQVRETVRCVANSHVNKMNEGAYIFLNKGGEIIV